MRTAHSSKPSGGGLHQAPPHREQAPAPPPQEQAPPGPVGLTTACEQNDKQV